MQRSLFCFMSLFPVLSFNATAAAEETVENPAYKMWSVWKEGAYATMQGENRFGEVVTVITTTQTLKKVSADKIIIEVTTATVANGQTNKAEPTTLEILAREPKLPPEVQEQLKAFTAKVKQTKGKETLTINGKKLDCEWVRSEGEGNDSKVWTSNQVPGETVKTESAVGPLKSNMQLIDWKGEKK
jgi:hypothetical protein